MYTKVAVTKFQSLLAVLAAIMLGITGMVAVGGGASAATPAPNDLAKIVQELTVLNPGVTYEQMLAAIRRTAIAESKTDLQVAKEGLAESRRVQTAGSSQLLAYSNPAVTHVTLGNAARAGDFFYTSAFKLGVDHGHTGIYSSMRYVIEAPGSGKKSHTTLASNVQVIPGAQKKFVRTTEAQRLKAVAVAKTLLNRPYNNNFLFNKTSKGAMNCSQLVWVAYKDGTGIDLDSNGGHGVYPGDIVLSSNALWYEYVR